MIHNINFEKFYSDLKCNDCPNNIVVSLEETFIHDLCIIIGIYTYITDNCTKESQLNISHPDTS